MQVGFNYPFSYNLYGYDIGPNPNVSHKQWLEERKLAETGNLKKIPLPPLFNHLDRNLRNLRKMKITIVRFLLANGWNFIGGLGPIRRSFVPSPNKLIYYNYRYSPPIEMDKRFSYHFELLLKKFHEMEMQIIPSFIDYNWGGKTHFKDNLYAGGRSDCFNDTNERKKFLDGTLKKLLDISRKYRNVIYAWEVINEPYWNCSGFGPLSEAKPDLKNFPGVEESFVGIARNPEVEVFKMNEFLTEAINLINSYSFKSTVGHRFFKDIDFQPIGPPSNLPTFSSGSLPQFHYYGKHMFGLGDPPQIESENLFNHNPKPFLGEFDSALNRWGKPWPELIGNDTTLKRLELLKKEGCDLALIWPDYAPTNKNFKVDEAEQVEKYDHLKLTTETRKAIVDFTGGVLPPDDE
ncbi:MAG: hypothetical protein IPM81_01930 [Saprospirales bacterium]|nr:hypothetical protein [Saprospirales bacterium]